MKKIFISLFVVGLLFTGVSMVSANETVTNMRCERYGECINQDKENYPNYENCQKETKENCDGSRKQLREGCHGNKHGKGHHYQRCINQ